MGLLLGERSSGSVKALRGLGRAAQSTRTARGSESRGTPRVLYVDRGVIVLNKPPGLVSQGTSTTSMASTGTAALNATNDRAAAGTAIPPPPESAFNDVLDGLRRRYGLGENPYPVHRLDKGTTGVLILARTKALARELSRQFRTRTIDKTYLALVRGDPVAWTGPSAGSCARAGLITAPLSLGPDGRVRVRIQVGQLEDRLYPREEARGQIEVGSDADAADLGPDRRLDGPDGLVGGNLKTAQTAWEVLASSDVAPLSLLRLRPHTGLKHQLRVHMARALGAPILGDALYGSATTSPPVSARTSVPEGRLFLHSSSISLWRYRREGLRKRLRLTITAPLPADFVKVCRDAKLDLPRDVIQGGVLVDGEHLGEEEIPGVGGRWIGEPVLV